jgi:hypothetical protein
MNDKMRRRRLASKTVNIYQNGVGGGVICNVLRIDWWNLNNVK